MSLPKNRESPKVGQDHCSIRGFCLLQIDPGQSFTYFVFGFGRFRPAQLWKFETPLHRSPAKEREYRGEENSRLPGVWTLHQIGAGSGFFQDLSFPKPLRQQHHRQ